MIDTKDLEQAIVGILMRDEAESDYYLSKLREEYFKFDAPKHIYNSIKRLKARKRPIDPFLIISDMRNYINEHKVSSVAVMCIFHNAPSSQNLLHYVQELIDYRHKDSPEIPH